MYIDFSIVLYLKIKVNSRFEIIFILQGEAVSKICRVEATMGNRRKRKIKRNVSWSSIK